IKRRYIGAYLTEDERFLVVTASIGTSGNELYIQDLKDPKGSLKPIVTGFDNDHYILDNVGTRLLIHTNLNAPNNRIVVTDFSNPAPETWKDLIPETESVMTARTAGGKIFTEYTVDVKSQIKQFTLDGKFEREVELPGIGSAGGFGGKHDDKEIY